jgi:DNA-binding winged helix-turn-helix (wHTH) protein
MDPRQRNDIKAPESGFEFGNFRLEPSGILFRGDARVHLTPKEFAALRFLLDHASEIVTAAQLRQALWGGIHVTADSVPRCVSSLRARLEPDNCIETVYKRGYRMKCAVRPFAASQPATLPRLAIVPFSCGLQVESHLGAAVSEETAARLATAAPAVAHVLARDSVFALSGGGLTALEIGLNLGADLVLTGILHACNSYFRLRVEMIRVKDGSEIWVEDMLVRRDRTDELATGLLHRLLHRLGGPATAPPLSAIAAGPAAPADPRAYDLYLRGHSEWQSMERRRMQSATEMLIQAAKINPELIAARIDLVHASVTQSFYGFLPPRAAVEQMRSAARSIPDVHRNAPAVLPALAWAALHLDHDLEKALELSESASHLPYDGWTTRVRVMMALSRHRFDEALDVLRGALQVDPLAPWLHARIAWTLHLAHRPWEAKEQAEYCLIHFPRHESTNFYASQILAFDGEPERAVVLAHELVERSPNFDIPAAVEAYALACAGKRHAAMATLDRLHWLGRERFVVSAFLPPVHLALGDAESAIEALKNSETLGCPWFFQLLADPRLNSLKGHPEFDRMCADHAAMEARVSVSELAGSQQT